MGTVPWHVWVACIQARSRTGFAHRRKGSSDLDEEDELFESEHYWQQIVQLRIKGDARFY